MQLKDTSNLAGFFFFMQLSDINLQAIHPSPVQMNQVVERSFGAGRAERKLPRAPCNLKTENKTYKY
jgi:hypothetical protein